MGKPQNKREKHSHAEVSTTVDAILTGAFFLLVGYVCWLFYNSTEDHIDLVYFLVCCALVTCAVKGVELFCHIVVRDIVSKRLLDSGDHPHPLGFESTYSKFVGTAWQFTIHTTMTACEGYLLWNETWLSHAHTSFLPAIYSPHDVLKYFYILQTAIWTMTCFSHRFNSDAHAHKDYALMYIHHLATIALVAISFHHGQTRLGLVVLFIHDCSDIGIDLLKLSNYLVLEGTSGCFLTEISYGFAIVMWAYFRLWYYPRYIIWGAIWALNFVDVGPSIFGDEPPILALVGDDFTRIWWIGLLGVILLSTLFFMHIWWFFLLLRILFRMTKGEDHRQIGSDEYDGDFAEKGTVAKVAGKLNNDDKTAVAAKVVDENPTQIAQRGKKAKKLE